MEDLSSTETHEGVIELRQLPVDQGRGFISAVIVVERRTGNWPGCSVKWSISITHTHTHRLRPTESERRETYCAGAAAVVAGLRDCSVVGF